MDEKYQTATWIFKNLSKNTITTIWMTFSQMLIKHTNDLRYQEPTKGFKIIINRKDSFDLKREKKGERTNHKRTIGQTSNKGTLSFT